MNTITFEEKDVYLLSGPATIEVDDGEIDVVGARLQNGDKIDIPTGKTLPVEALSASSINLHQENGEEPEKLGERTIPDDWDELVNEMKQNPPEVVLMLGEMDSGKTFFSTYVTNQLLEVDDSVSVMDCDLGQTDIGTPGTVGLATVETPTTALDNVGWDVLSFVGSHSPGLHMVPFLSSIRSLADHALEHTDSLMVDTTGWVQGDGGRAVKQGKIDMLDPDYVVLLQKDRELEHLVKTVPDDRIRRVTVSDKVQATPPSERQSLRERNMKQYMKDAKQHTINLRETATERIFFNTGEPLELDQPGVLRAENLSGFEGILVIKDTDFNSEVMRELAEEYGNVRTVEPGFEKGILVGFADDRNRCYGVGVVEEIDYEDLTISVHTPLENPGDFARVQFGSLRYTPTGEEHGFVEPGSM
ncbi:MAG: Clp1/GlmU family protein [bacterium]